MDKPSTSSSHQSDDDSSSDSSIDMSIDVTPISSPISPGLLDSHLASPDDSSTAPPAPLDPGQKSSPEDQGPSGSLGLVAGGQQPAQESQPTSDVPAHLAHIVRRPRKKKPPPAKKKKRPLSPCRPDCRFKCTEKISQERRMEICDSYNNLHFQENYKWLKTHAFRLQGEKKRARPSRKKKADSDRKPRKTNITYNLPAADGDLVQVCQKFFMTTLGKHANANGAIAALIDRGVDKNGVVRPKMSGKWDRTKDHQITVKIVAFIESLNPQV